MKNLLLVLLVSVLLIGCGGNEPQNTELEKTSTKRVLIDEFTNKGTNQSPVMYSEKGLFNGIGFDNYDNGQLEYESNYKNGKKNGLMKRWYKSGSVHYEKNYNDGEMDGLQELFHKNGQLEMRGNYTDGERDGVFKYYSENGQLKYEKKYKNGERIDKQLR